jgi:hypothetical protein
MRRKRKETGALAKVKSKTLPLMNADKRGLRIFCFANALHRTAYR